MSQMFTFKCPSEWSLLDASKHARKKGWKMIKATYSKGVRQSRIPKYVEDELDLIPKVKEIPPRWNILYTPEFA